MQKTMKTIFLLTTAMIISMAGFAQFSIGIQGTGTLSNAKFTEEEGLDINKKMRAMPGGGLVAQLQLKEKLAIRSGVSFIKHGITATGTIPENGDQPAVTAKTETDLNYLQVPVNVLYTVPLSRIKLFAGGGVYFNYGLSGKIKIESSTTLPDGTPYSFKDEIDAFKKVSENGSGMKRTEFGVGALAGIQFNNLFANVGYQLGLSNSAGDGDGTYKQHGLQFTLGYFFFGDHFARLQVARLLQIITGSKILSRDSLRIIPFYMVWLNFQPHIMPIDGVLFDHTSGLSKSIQS
jgi:Outer membrane protein beta-barrel domain